MQLDLSRGIGGTGEGQKCTPEDAVVTSMVAIVENRAGSGKSDRVSIGALGTDSQGKNEVAG